MLFIVTAQAKLGFQGNSIGQSTLHTLFDGVTGRVNKIIKKLQYENVTGVRDREVFLEHTEQTLYVSFVRSGFELEKLFEGLNLNRKEIRRIGNISNFAEVDPLIRCCRLHKFTNRFLCS